MEVADEELATVFSLSLSLLALSHNQQLDPLISEALFSSTEVLAAKSKVQASHLEFFLTVHCFPLDRQTVAAFS